jgi:predicted transposase YbfD/YdcC
MGDVPNLWLQFDFQDRRVSISSYSMQSHADVHHIPRSWAIERSNDDADWIELNRHDNDKTVQSGHAFQNFKCPSRDDDRMFRYI